MYASRQSWPRLHERLVDARTRGGQRLVHDERRRRGVVEDEHDLREQAMAPAEVDDPPAPEQPAHAPRHLPGLVELLARQATPRGTPREPADRRASARKSPEVLVGQPPAGGVRERHG